MRSALIMLLVLALALAGAAVPAAPALGNVVLSPCCLASGHNPLLDATRTCCCGGDGACCEVRPAEPAGPRPTQDSTPPPERPVRIDPLAPATIVPADTFVDADVPSRWTELVRAPGFATSHSALRRHLALSVLTD